MGSQCRVTQQIPQGTVQGMSVNTWCSLQKIYTSVNKYMTASVLADALIFVKKIICFTLTPALHCVSVELCEVVCKGPIISLFSLTWLLVPGAPLHPSPLSFLLCLFQTLQSLLTNWWCEPGVFDSKHSCNMQNVQCSSTWLGTTHL